MLRTLIVLSILVVAALGVWWFWKPTIKDEAMRLGLEPADFPQLKADVFEGMDAGHGPLSADEIKGRNTWNLWTGGSERFLDWLAREGYGISDTLKMIDSRQRGSRFERLGLINEPGFQQATKPDKWGLWLDVPVEGDKGRIDRMIAAEGIDERVYGRSTGVFGLRLFPNPEFDDEARAAWDPERYYNDKNYASHKGLVRPYRVGMSCGVCHIAPHPLNPPADPNNPDWHNLSSTIGNQYIREGAVFATNLEPPAPGEPSSFLWEMVNLQPPGTSDTSRMATDHINNPNAINAIFHLDERLRVATENPKAKETMSAATEHLPPHPAPADGSPPQDGTANPRFVPHVLKDGADSVGVPGATIRVYVNIGLFSEQWLELHKPLIGVKYQQPFEVEVAQKNSVYWRATEDRLLNVKKFLATARPYRLADATWTDAAGREHSGRQHIASADVLNRGKLVFAENCARCHSSKRPPAGFEAESEEEAEWFRNAILDETNDFVTGNFLSDDRRHSIAEVKTNAGRALGTNAKRGHIWDNFSSETYKQLPAVKKINVYNPLTGKDLDYVFDLEKRGTSHSVGYYRTPSLISLWSSAPVLHNNALGRYTGDPSVAGRLEAFGDAMEKLLWPEKRDGIASIWRTQHESFIEIPISYLPRVVRAKLKLQDELLETNKLGDEVLRLGPIPAGTPINLLGSLDLSLGSIKDTRKAIGLAELAVKIKRTLIELKLKNLTGDEAREHMRANLLPSLLDNSKCPDLIMDRGHAFGTRSLEDQEKRDLIEFLKTL